MAEEQSAPAEEMSAGDEDISLLAGTKVASGTCGAEGDNLTWELDSEGTLTITGTGAMADDYVFPEKASVKRVIHIRLLNINGETDWCTYDNGTALGLTVEEEDESIVSKLDAYRIPASCCLFAKIDGEYAVISPADLSPKTHD